MCGIAGQIGYEQDMRKMSAVMTKLSAVLAPRGPDASGVYIDESAFLVHRRLIVIDPENGAQPMSTGNYTLYTTVSFTTLRSFAGSFRPTVLSSTGIRIPRLF